MTQCRTAAFTLRSRRFSQGLCQQVTLGAVLEDHHEAAETPRSWQIFFANLWMTFRLSRGMVPNSQGEE